MSNEWDGHSVLNPGYTPQDIDEEFGSIVGGDHNLVTAELEHAAFLLHQTGHRSARCNVASVDASVAGTSRPMSRADHLSTISESLPGEQPQRPTDRRGSGALVREGCPAVRPRSGVPEVSFSFGDVGGVAAGESPFDRAGGGSVRARP